MHSSHPRDSSAVAASALVPDTSKDTESEMEISIASDVTHQPSSTTSKWRQPPVATTSTSADPVLDQFQQMRSIISTYLGEHWDPTPSPTLSFCNYLYCKIKHLEERDFLTFRNETVNARDRSQQVNRSPHITFKKHHRPQQDRNT